MGPDPDRQRVNADSRCICFGDFTLLVAAVRVAEDWLVAGMTTRHLPIYGDPCVAAQRLCHYDKRGGVLKKPRLKDLCRSKGRVYATDAARIYSAK